MLPDFGMYRDLDSLSLDLRTYTRRGAAIARFGTGGEQMEL